MHPGTRAPRDDSGGTERAAGAGRPGVSASTRLLTSFVVGLAAAWALTVATSWRVGLLVGWMAAAALFVTWTWLTIGGMDAEATRAHSGREDSTRAVTDAAFLTAAVASLGAVALLLLGGASIVGGRPAQAALSFASVVLA